MSKVQPKQQYETFEAASYPVSHLEFITKDNDGLPIYVISKSGNNMIARYKTYALDTGDTPFDTNTQREILEGPPGSINRGQLPLLVHAFGGDPSQLPKDELKALIKAEQLIKESKKEVTVIVGDKGWIRTVYDMDLPVGDYVFSYSDIPRKNEDGDPILSTTKFGTFLITRLVVDNPNSPFYGVPKDIWINWETMSILQALAPAAYDLFMGNGLVGLMEMIKNEKGKVMGTVELTERGRPKLNKSTLRVVTDTDVSDSTGTPTLGPIEHLYQAIADDHDKKPWRESEAFEGVGTFSQLGKMWAKTKLAPLCVEFDIPKKFSQMNTDNVRKLLEELGRNDLVNLMVESDESW